MSRRRIAKRAAIGVPYAFLYVFVLFPIALVVGVVLGAVALLWGLVTGDVPEFLVDTIDRTWSWVGGNMHWTLTGRGSFEWLP